MKGFDVTPFLHQPEGQHFERKSLFHGAEGKKKARPRREVRDQVASYVAAFANAEGGVLVLGVEDDGALSGHGYPEGPLKTFLLTPQSRLKPPQDPGFAVVHEGVELIVFEVQASDVPVQVTGDGFPLRMGDATVQASESQIQGLKFKGMAESWESRPSPLTLDDLDGDLLAAAKLGAGLQAMDDQEYLLRRKLADRRGSGIGLRRAAELVFAELGPEHPNAGVRLFRVVGSERRLGAEHNVEERPWIEGSLPHVLDEAMETIGGLLRRPSRLVGSKFRPMPEYPEFAWKEALLNAVVHRDYSSQGRCVEVWLYDDRMEVLSPGGLLDAVPLQDLRELQRLHAARNPRLARVLMDLGYMRGQGEGIPRIFYEMQGSFLPEPEIDEQGAGFSVTLRNTPTLTEADRSFVAGLDGDELSQEEFRALLEAHRRGQVDNALLRRLTGLETLQASRVLGRLRERKFLNIVRAGAASYYTLHPRLQSEGGEFDEKTGELDEKTGELDEKTGELMREDLLEQLPDHLRSLVLNLSARPRRAQFKKIVQAVAAQREWTPQQLATLFGRTNVRKLVDEHLSPMVAEGTLERTHPEILTHPQQAYRAVEQPLGPLFERVDDQEEQ